jgi:malate dehydrogenase (oxaloacetate-decarboxylating)
MDGSIAELDALAYRQRYRGLIGVESKLPVRDRHLLSLVYTPGVAAPCLEIEKDPRTSFDYTCRGNTVGIVTDGSAVLSLGAVGPEAALPAMEGKAVLLKTFANVDAVPLCLKCADIYEIIQVISLLAPTFGAFCLEDISSPRCFTVEDHLQRAVNVPIFHNHAHGAGVQVLAGLSNALPLVGKTLQAARIVIAGAGAAGIGTARLLRAAGARNLIVCDSAGALFKYRTSGMNWVKNEIARSTNPEDRKGTLADVLQGADVFIGFSARGVLTPAMVQGMAPNPIVFALAVPDPEILPGEAKAAGAAVVATARTDFPNELDIALVFPGVLRGLLDAGARNVNDAMLLAAAGALAGLVPPAERRPDFIVPGVMDFRVAPALAGAVARAAVETGEARRQVDPAVVAARTLRDVYEGPGAYVPPPPRAEMTLAEQALDLHKRHQGKLQVKSKIPIKDRYILSLFYLPPGAAAPCRVIARDPAKVYDYTAKGNLVAVVSDGSAVLGLGNIGARAAMPVMEGKSVLFKTFGGVEAFPICVGSQDPEEIIQVVQAIAPAFGGVNLEDISAPRCFEVEERLKKDLDIPVFHDDQHGTAVVVLGALLNALKVTGRKLAEARLVINGAGASAIAVSRLFLKIGVKDLILCDTKGIVYEGRTAGMNPVKAEMARVTNRERRTGTLADALAGADVFIGLSVAKAVTPDMVRAMGKDAIVFAMANPVPEIFPDEAKAGGAAVVATGRSDFENQVNNSLGFPGIFRGALDVRAREINDTMKVAAGEAIAALVSDKELKPDYIIPTMMDLRVPPAVAEAVARAAIETGVARNPVDPTAVAENARRYLYEGQLQLLA